MNQRCFRSFDDYAAAYPDGERFRNWINCVRPVRKRRRKNAKRIAHPPEMLLIFPMHSPSRWNHIPGGYLWLKVNPWGGKYVLSCHDNDDGMMQHTVSTQAEAKKIVDDVEMLAPLDWEDLKDFGFVWY